MNSTIQHIVWVIPGFADGVEDDVCIPAALLLLEKFAEMEGVIISVIAIHYPYKELPYELFGFKVYPLNGANKRFGRNKLEQKFQHTFYKIHQNNTVNLLHSFWLNDTACFADQISISENIPHICTLMGQDARLGNNKVAKIKSKNTKYLTVSSFHQNTFFDNYQITSKVIHLGTEDLVSASEKTIDLICVGALIDLKKTINCIELVEFLKQDFPNITCYIVGDGPNYKIIKKEIIKRKLDRLITLTGQVSRKKSLELIQRSKVLFHPSKYESYGMILAEAMAFQTHVVARNTGLSFEEPIIHKFENIEDAANRVSILLNSDKLPDQKIYSISETASKYIENVYLPNLRTYDK